MIQELLKQSDHDWADIGGIVYYKGPGSFTGLRIGAALANALAGANIIPLASANGDGWIETGIKDLEAGKSAPALPYYGAEPHITIPKK
jgi:tRNA threonylcarbamoyladenosine biosynthesis protein TsaB